MLKEFELGKNSKYDDLKLKDLRKEFGILQRKINLNGCKVLILIEGFEASGKGYVISELVNDVNHKYVKVNEYLERKTSEKYIQPFIDIGLIFQAKEKLVFLISLITIIL